MAVYSFYVGTYARAIYIGGTRRFTERDGVQGIPAEYHEPVKQYAATNFIDSEIDGALTKTWINEQEHADTMAYKYPA